MVAFLLNTTRTDQNGRYPADENFNLHFFERNLRILIEINLKFVPAKAPADSKSSLV